MSEEKYNDQLNFGLIGAAGYIAPRHMKAIKETGNNISVAYDISDSVGILDTFFPDCDFVTNEKDFLKFLLKKGKNNNSVLDFISIVSPNHLHKYHIEMALRLGSNAICEKPLVLSLKNLESLIEFQKSTGFLVFSILQLRLHPKIIQFKKDFSYLSKKIDVNLTYITSRGKWYHKSWKGKLEKSGGIAANIGGHFFDMLGYLFGDFKDLQVHFSSNEKIGGFIEFEKARVRWFLSIDYNDLPHSFKIKGQRTFRSIHFDNREIEFSKGFEDLHTLSYKEIFRGSGFEIEENRNAIEIIEKIRYSEITGIKGDFHPFLKDLKS